MDSQAIDAKVFSSCANSLASRRLKAGKAQQNAYVMFALSAVAVLWVLLMPAGQPAAYRFASRPHASAVPRPPTDNLNIFDTAAAPANETLRYFVDTPLRAPWRDALGELGRRTRVVGDWLARADSSPAGASAGTGAYNTVERGLAALYPFLRTDTSLAELRGTPGATGVVVPVSDWTLRPAAQLIAQMRDAVRSELPIVIAYAGDVGLGSTNRNWLATHLAQLTDEPGHVDFLDLTAVFDDTVAQLEDEAAFADEAVPGRAVAVFAALAAPFQTVVVVDPAVVLVQPPERLVEQPYFARTGTYLARGRGRPDGNTASSTARRGRTPRTRVGGGEAQHDAGVVALDKGRIDVLMGLFHAAWQNSLDVRDELGCDADEAWWTGLEAVGAAYDFARHPPAVVGCHVDAARVCGPGIAHLDHVGRPVWYRGPGVDGMAKGQGQYPVPRAAMAGGDWVAAATDDWDKTCMVGGDVWTLTDEEQEVLIDAMNKAELIDKYFVDW